MNDKYKNKILTIPNILSFLRVCMIPVIVWLYAVRHNHLAALGVLLLSALTDIVDGIIARRCNMVSDFGKIFDPIADKLTQIATLFCLISRFWYMMYPFVFLVIKECTTALTSLISISKTNDVKSAVWHGKLTTVSLYAMMALHLLWYEIPQSVSMITVGVCIGIMLMSFIMYTAQNIKAIKGEKN